MTMTTTERRSAHRANQARIEREIQDGKRCPDCGSHDTIPWADGWMCRDCGCEWGKDNGYL